ncbi:hypothetical protein AK88_04263 [Plasmodium fragile]|uniref:Schizont-infected cell agglutination C-terminal domain-containing protein n=1 Tax=Plasmodium fragile TaxID=5857 RepID=A0A0D9QH18_PLAFR|nr:uncharacterized protein AK88_04263 [Plasmodium fragile]KJP86072.1 hypothetical protein AK88_04263 [Plasmodium fragile]
MAAKFVDLLQQYAQRRSIDTSKEEGPGSFPDLIWKDIENIFNELMIYKKRPESSIHTLCSHRGEINGRKLQGAVQRVLCVEIMKVFFFMDGIKSTKDAGSVLHKDEHELVQYLRCIIGSVYLLKWSKDKCQMNGVIDYVRDAMPGIVGLYGASGGSDKCDWINMEHIGIGGRVVAAEVQNWMDKSKARDRRIAQGIKICSQEKHRGKHTSEGTSNTGTGILELLKHQDDGAIRKFIHEEQHMPKAVAQEIIRGVGRGQIDANKLQDKISKGVKEGWSTGEGTEVNGQPTREPDAESKDTQTKGGTTRPVHTSTTSPTTRSGTGTEDGSTTVTKPAPPQPVAPEGTETPQAPTAADKKPKKEEAPPVKVPEVPREVIPEEKIPVPTPPSDAQAPAVGPGGRSDTPPADASVGTQKGKDEETAGKCTRETTVFTHSNTAFGLNGARATITLSIASSSENADDCDTTPQDSGPGDAVVDGGNGAGNDDPPPLNPPKPKPNPNPNQSGSSGGSGGEPDSVGGISGGAAKGGAGGGSSGGVGASSGGGGGGDGGRGGGGGSQLTSGSSNQNDQDTGNTTQAGTKPFEVDLASPALNIEGATGGFVPPVPADGHVSSSGETPRDYAVPDLTGTVLTATTPILFFLTSVTVALLGYSLWKYFAHLAKRRRTYRIVRDVPSPPLEEEILQHLQRGDLPPPDYGYTMVTQPASTSGRGRPPRVHKRTIIELHLEVLNECAATEWENVKDDYLQLLVEQFMAGNTTCTSSSDVCTPDDGFATQDSTTNADSRTRDTPTYSDEPDACPRNDEDPDPWSSMEHIELAAQQNAHSNPEHAPSYCIHWINWIEQRKHILRQCTTQPWFLQLKAEWKQYLREHMVANAAHGVYVQRAFGEVATMERNKLDAWKEWVAKQHELLNIHGEEEWFQHLWSNIEETGVVTEHDGMPEQIRMLEGVSHIHTVDEKPTTFVTEHGPTVEKGLQVQEALDGGSALKVRHVPRPQPLHKQPYMKKPLTATIWILILALVIEQCEVERNLQETELYVDELLQQL